MGQPDAACSAPFWAAAQLTPKRCSTRGTGYPNVIARGKTLVLAAGLGFLKRQWERFRFKVLLGNGASLIEVPQSGCFLVSASVVKVILF